jgi:hypothetical protein
VETGEVAKPLKEKNLEQQRGPAPNRGKHAKRSPALRARRALTWMQNANKFILGLGAAATAIAAVVALFLSLTPKYSVQNTAHFISIQPLAAEPLSDYTGEAPPTAAKQVLKTICTKANGQQASPAACADNIAGHLAGSDPAMIAPGGSRPVAPQPLGELISVNLQVQGLQGQSVNLSWTIFPQNGVRHLSGRWLQPYPAEKIEPTTDDDTGSFVFWIPLPEQAGPYFIRLALTVDNEGLASADSGPFD